MKKMYHIRLQMFGEGGGDGASAADGSLAGAEAGASEASKGRGGSKNALANVVYGTQDDDSTAESSAADTTTAKSKSQSFEEMIKGEYKEEFQKRTQSIIDKRFKEAKQTEEALRSHDAILNMLADKYGVDVNDIDGLQKAIEDDESFLEEEAMQKGLTVKQLKEMKQLQKENDAFRRAQEEAEERQKTQEIYSKWMQEGEDLKAKYGLENFDLGVEAQNPDFTQLLRNGVSVEAAYKAIHMDDMLSGAMARTANVVKQQMANGIAGRQSRPAENGISSTSNAQFKSDVNSLTKADRAEIMKRVARGEIIKFG